MILSISDNPAVSETRRLILEQRGFAVMPATNFVEVREKCQQQEIACIIVGMDIEPQIKRAIGNILAESCPLTPLLEICQITPEIEGGSAVHSDAAEDLLAAIDDLLKPSGNRYNQQLYHRAKVITKKAAETTARAKERRVRLAEIRTSYLKLRFSRRKKPEIPTPFSPPRTPRDSSSSW